MVDQRVFIEGIIDTGKVLTFTPIEAIENNYCEGIADNVHEVLTKVGVTEYTIVEYEPSLIERIIGWLVHPMISGLLIMAIIGGIYFEMQTPGIGFPLGIAVLAAVAYFAPLYLEGLAANWEILVFIIGIILVALEIFVIPGFGVAGVSGVVLIFVSLVLSLINNINFDFEHVELHGVGVAITTVVIGIFGGFILSLYFGNKVFSANSGPFKNMGLKTVQNTEDGFICVETGMFALKGKTGIANTVLRPAGKVFIENEVFDAIAINGFIEQNEKIIVTKVEATQLYVDLLEEK